MGENIYSEVDEGRKLESGEDGEGDGEGEVSTYMNMLEYALVPYM